MRNSVKQTAMTLASLLLCLAYGAVTGLAQSSGGPYQITSSVVGSGGGISSGAGNKVIEGTAGQTAAGGPTNGSSISHQAGFWSAALVAAATPTPTPTPTATISISDVTQAEGNSGVITLTFTVSLSAASLQPVTVNFATADGTANVTDYQPASGTLSFTPGETSKQISVLVNGDTQVEPDETLFVNLSSPVNALILKMQGTGIIVNDDGSAGPTFQFGSGTYSVQEDLGSLTIVVIRSGDTSTAASVDYLTGDGSAKQKSDYEYAAGTLTFAPGESSKTLTLLINEDVYVEGSETFNVSLANPAGAALGQQKAAAITIVDDLPESIANPIDDPGAFVYMHYHDFLNREPDAAGLAFWINQITSCGKDEQCVEAKRINVSAAFFLSIEFQETGYLRYLLGKESFGAMPRYTEFLRDVQEVSRGVIVNSPGWQQKLTENQEQFAEKWVQRPAFKALYDGMSNPEFVNAIYTNAGILPSPAKVQSLVSALDGHNQSRAAVLLAVANDTSFRQKEYSSAFVMMQYFGYLRRDPNSDPDSDFSGYNFWLMKLNAFDGDFRKAEMVRAFIISLEYRARFAQ
jgi:hypothetical protein